MGRRSQQPSYRGKIYAEMGVVLSPFDLVIMIDIYFRIIVKYVDMLSGMQESAAKLRKEDLCQNVLSFVTVVIGDFDITLIITVTTVICTMICIVISIVNVLSGV